jgi:uncharacterized protein (TIGR02453 family)
MLFGASHFPSFIFHSSFCLPEGMQFTPKTLSFLRALKRHNEREWFRERKDQYEQHVRAPMIAVVEQLARDLPSFAPELIADARRSLYRIYRDTRFSEDKSPLKTHVAAVFPPRDGEKHRSAGLYFEVAPGWVWAGGGLYAPSTADLYRVREHIATHLTQLRAIVEAPAFRRQCGALKGDRLTRVPRGFPSDHPAAEFLTFKQYLAWREFPGDFAVSPRFYRGLLDVFRAAAPLVRYLNTALKGAQ